MRRVISLWLPTWPTDRLHRHLCGSGHEPAREAAGTGSAEPKEPLVTRGHDGRRQVVAAADPAAQRLGLRTGMPLARAQAMVPGLRILPADPVGDAAALGDLAAWCLRYAPLTAPEPPEGIWIDATGCAALHGGEAALLAELLARLGRAGIAGRAAIADTPAAAWALARHGAAPLTVLPPGTEAEALAPLPLAALRLPAEVVRGLLRVGVARIGELAAMPRAPLARRFGGAVLHRLDQALGDAPEPIAPVVPAEAVQAALSFAEPLLTAEALRHATETLVAKACEALHQAGLGARGMALVFDRVDAWAQVLRIGTARPSRDPRHLARLLTERLEAVDPGFGIEAMRLVVTRDEALAAEQLGADEAGAPDLAPLVDRLGSRFGPRRVFRLHPVESDVPERAAARVAPLARPAATIWPASLPRPVRLLSPPQPVEAVSALPDSPPAAFTWRRVRHRVRRADGPERIAGEWWRRDAERRAMRDYWAVEDETGQRFWLYRRGDGTDPATGDLAWFVHGVF